MMNRWKCVCAYDGTGFNGWQSQPGGGGIQDAIEARLAAVLGTATRIHGSGRTDAGVHARAQVFHFDAAWRHGPDKLAAALGSRLSPAIQIVSVRRAGPRFHARFSATGKVYAYRIRLGAPDPFERPFCWALLRPVDVAAMRSAAAVLVGRHDFKAFSAANGADPEESGGTVRHLRRLEVLGRGRAVRIVAEADGFLYKMVRRLAGALVAVGEGKLDRADLVALLSEPTRTARIETAPPQGLFLERVSYR